MGRNILQSKQRKKHTVWESQMFEEEIKQFHQKRSKNISRWTNRSHEWKTSDTFVLTKVGSKSLSRDKHNVCLGTFVSQRTTQIEKMMSNNYGTYSSFFW